MDPLSSFIIKLIKSLGLDILKDWIYKTFFKKKVPEPIQKQTIIIFGNYIKEYKGDIDKIKVNWNINPFEYINGRFTTKENRPQLNANLDVRKQNMYIESSKCIYPPIYNLLQKNARTGFELYFLHKLVVKQKLNLLNDFISVAMRELEDLPKKYVEIKYWYNVFKKIDLNGDLIGILLPIAKSTKFKSNFLINEFTKFVEVIYNNDIGKAPFMIGKNIVGLVYIGKIWKKDERYFNSFCDLKIKGCNRIVVCGWGVYRNKVSDIVSQALETFADLREEVYTTSGFEDFDSFVNNRVDFEGLYVHLLKR